MSIMNKAKERLLRDFAATLFLATTALLAACSAIPAAETGGPLPNQPIYPVLLQENSERREATLNAASRALSAAATDPGIELQPVTATVAGLTPNQPLPLYLPKLGTSAVMNEDETRESLRRFLIDWQNIIGSDPAHLSLVRRISEASGTEVANYEQRPFRHPIRGGFGTLEIRFGKDRRILNITSTCIPDAESLQPMLAAITPTLKPEDAAQYVLQNGVTFTDPNGQLKSFKPNVEQVEVREPVLFVTRSQEALQFHLAWAIELKEAPVKVAYLDAIRAEILGVE